MWTLDFRYAHLSTCCAGGGGSHVTADLGESDSSAHQALSALRQVHLAADVGGGGRKRRWRYAIRRHRAMARHMAHGPGETSTSVPSTSCAPGLYRNQMSYFACQIGPSASYCLYAGVQRFRSSMDAVPLALLKRGSLLMAAEQGSKGLFHMPNRTKCTLLVPSDAGQRTGDLAPSTKPSPGTKPRPYLIVWDVSTSDTSVYYNAGTVRNPPCELHC
jgi:hypothetical protein